MYTKCMVGLVCLVRPRDPPYNRGFGNKYDKVDNSLTTPSGIELVVKYGLKR